MTELTKEQQQAIAIAQAKRKRAEAEQSQGQGDTMGFVNKGMATALGAPVDITNALLGSIGLGSEKPFGGSESIRSGMKNIGAPTPDRAPEGLGEQMAMGTGEALGFAAPASAAAKVYQGSKGVAGAIARPFNEMMVKSPVSAVGIEAISGAGMGAGREIAEQNEFGPGGTMMMEMAGGMSPAAFAISPTRLALRGGKKVTDLGKKALIPFTKSGAEPRAARRLQGVATDPEEAARLVEAYEGSPISPAARTEQQGLLELEDAVLRGDPARRQNMSQRTSDSIAEMRTAIEGESNIGPVKRLIEQRKQRALSTLDARTEQAADDAARALDDLGDVSAEEATMTVQERLRSALDDARVEENRLWSRIPEKTKAPVSNTIGTYQKLQSKLARAQRDDMPASARAIIGPRATRKAGGSQVKRTTIQELDGLYKKLGEEATQARAAKEFNKARIAEDLRESILDDISNADGGPAVQETIQTARAYSRELNDKFRKGPVGKIMGYGREGGQAIDPSLGMERTIGRPGQTGELGRRAIAKATQDDPTALEGMQNYIKARFTRNAVKDGRVDPTAARTFIKNNGELLGAFPGLRNQLQSARNLEDVSRRVTKRADFFRKALDKPAVSATARVLNAPVDQEVERIFKSDDPAEVMSSIMRTIRKNKGGDALKGMKSGVGQYLIKTIESPSLTDEVGRSYLNGRKLQRMIDNPSTLEALQKVYSPPEMARLKYMAELLGKFQTQRIGKREVIPISGDAPAWLLDKVAQVAGAKMGSRMSGSTGASIQSASIGSSTARTFLKKLTADKAEQLLADAIDDEKLFTQLLRYKPNASGAAKARMDKTLRAWMAGPGARLFQDDEDEEMGQ